MGIKKSIVNGKLVYKVRHYENGRGSKRVQRTFDRKADAEQFLVLSKKKSIDRKLGLTPAEQGRVPTFEEASSAWLTHGALRFSPSHLKKASAIVRDVSTQCGEFSLMAFDLNWMSEFQQLGIQSGRSPSTVNRHTEVIRAIVNHALVHRKILRDPAVGFKKLRPKQVEVQFWSPDEAASFLAYANVAYPPGSPGRWIYVAYLTALNTGMRAGEIWGLRLADINHVQGSIRVKRQFDRVSQRFEETKGRDQRVVPAGPELIRELGSLGRRNSCFYTVFVNHEGNPVCHDNFSNRNFNKDVEIWGGKPIRFHDMRHTYTTYLVSSGVDLKTVQSILGHKNIQTTMRYAHLLGSAIKNVAEKFALSGTKEGVSAKFG